MKSMEIIEWLKDDSAPAILYQVNRDLLKLDRCAYWSKEEIVLLLLEGEH